MLLSSRLVSAAVEYKGINSRLIWVRFKLGVTVFLLAASTPVSSIHQVNQGVLGEFRDILRSVKQNKKIIIYGDLNR